VATGVTQPRDGQVSTTGSLLEWVTLIVRWRKLVCWTAFFVMVAGLAIVLLLPANYVATAVLLPPQQGSAAEASLLGQLSMAAAAGGASGSIAIKNPNDQQVSLLKSRTVENAVIARFQLQSLYGKKYASSARRKWEKMSVVENGLKDGLIRVSVTDSDPQRAAALANGWVEEYRRFTASLAVTEAQQRRLFYEQQLKAAHEDLNKAEEAMQQTEGRTGVIDLEGQGRSMIASAAVLRGQLAAKQIEIRAMREFAAAGNPDLQRAQQEASGMEAQLASMDADADRKSGDLIAPAGKVTQASVEYERALREVKYRETIQDLLTRQYEGARVDEAREGPMIQIVESALPPDRPESMYRILMVGGILLLAFPLGIIAAMLAQVIVAVRAMRLHYGTSASSLAAILSGRWKSPGIFSLFDSK
jgi:tyrosine-protein kinase Etk/Wzc